MLKKIVTVALVLLSLMGVANAAQDVTLSGTAAYSADLSAGTVALHVAQISNPSATYTTGTLRVELWLASNAYSGSGTLLGNRVALLPIQGSTNGQLGPNQSFSNINGTVPLTNLPGAGTYSAILVVTEYTQNCGTSDGYCLEAYSNFSTPFVISSGTGGGGGPSSVQIVGAISYQANAAAGTVQLTVAKLLNNSASYYTGSLRLELWLSTQAYSGGTFNGYKVAEYQITGTTNGQLGPGQSFSNLTPTVPLTNLPGSGTYYATLFVTEYTQSCGSSDGYCTDTYAPFTGMFTVGSGADTGGNGNLQFVGPVSYSVSFSANTVQINVAKIQNNSTTYTTGTLRLELWLTTSQYQGGSITGNRIATASLASGSSTGQLGPGQYFANISSTPALTNLPSAGSYYASLLLTEYTKNCGSSDGYCIVNYALFANQMSVPAPVVAPVDVPAATDGGASSGGAGGGGSIDLRMIVLLALGAVVKLLRRIPRSAVLIGVGAALSGCVTAGIPNASGVPPVQVDPATAGPVSGVGIEGHDIVSMTDQMMRDLLTNPQLASGAHPPRIVIDSQYFKNTGSQAINRDIITNRLRVNLNRAAQGRMVFITRTDLTMVQGERDLQAQGETDQGTTAKGLMLGADYRLRGEIAALDSRSARTGLTERYNQITFEMVDVGSGAIVWSGQYEFERAAADDVMYR